MNDVDKVQAVIIKFEVKQGWEIRPDGGPPKFEPSGRTWENYVTLDKDIIHVRDRLIRCMVDRVLKLFDEEDLPGFVMMQQRRKQPVKETTDD